MSECWIWVGSTDRNGYPQRKWNNTNYMIHRLMYENEVAIIPDGMTIDHLCRVTTCINPAHMEIVTPEENRARGMGISNINATKTHCSSGHKFTSKTVYLYKNKWRQCKICTSARLKKTYLLNKEKVTI